MAEVGGTVYPVSSNSAEQPLSLKPRPIIIGNMFIWLYKKIWDKRLQKKIHFDEIQKGLVCLDGFFENVKTLQQIIKSQSQRKKEYDIVFTDLAKAFGTVSHKSITIVVKRKGILKQIISTILDTYTDSYTSMPILPAPTQFNYR